MQDHAPRIDVRKTGKTIPGAAYRKDPLLWSGHNAGFDLQAQAFSQAVVPARTSQIKKKTAPRS